MKFVRLDWLPVLAIIGGTVAGAITFEVLEDAFEGPEEAHILRVPVQEAPRAEPPVQHAPLLTRPQDNTSSLLHPLVYLDGERMPSTFDVGSLSPGDIERIEVVKGVAAIELFGSDASDGVVQIYLKEPGSRGR